MNVIDRDIESGNMLLLFLVEVVLAVVFCVVVVVAVLMMIGVGGKDFSRNERRPATLLSIQYTFALIRLNGISQVVSEISRLWY